MAPVEFDIEVVVLLATNILEYITFAPEIIPPEPPPVIIDYVLMLFTLRVAIALLNVNAELPPKDPESLN